jgi:toxin-antitoxin system PIN domain toxin
VNVLIALFDAAHVHHEAAHQWFAKSRTYGWATCPLTENAFVRVLSSPSYSGQATTSEDAITCLRMFCAAQEHIFWPDAVTLRERGRFRWKHVQGHRQIMDIYLLALAVANNGRLVTFDATIALKAVDGASQPNLEVIDA